MNPNIERIKEITQMIEKWDDLAKDNPDNINNLSTSERQDWVDEIKDLSMEVLEMDDKHVGDRDIYTKNKEIAWFLGEVIIPIKYAPNIVSSGGRYHESWDWLMKAIEKVHKEYYGETSESRDLMFTINFLLGGGEKFKDGTKYSSLEFNLKNLHERVYEFIVHTQRNKK